MFDHVCMFLFGLGRSAMNLKSQSLISCHKKGYSRSPFFLQQLPESASLPGDKRNISPSAKDGAGKKIPWFTYMNELFLG